MVPDDTIQVYRPHGGLFIPTSLNMFALFEFAAYALVALVGAASLAVLRHRYRQRSLQNIPGPLNPSFFLGKLHGLEKTGHMLNE